MFCVHIAYIVTSLVILTFVTYLAAFAFAPEGYEDESGFHYVRPNDVSDRACDRATPTVETRLEAAKK